MILLLGLLGCPRPLPPHLAMDGPTTDRTATPITSVDEAIVAWMDTDPLVRTPRIPSAELLDGLDGGADLARLARTIERLERTGGEVERELGREATLQQERTTPLVRGYLWRRAENALTRPTATTPPLVTQITPLRTRPADAALAVDPLAFLGDAEAKRRYGERWVLESWLFRPDQPHGAVGERLDAPQYAHLAATPTGRLLQGRKAKGPVDAGFAALERATVASLRRAAADRDQEQAAWADQLLDLRDELSTDEPIDALLQNAFDGLISGAADDEAAGGALVALAAQRWLGTCPDAPCDGLDRTALFTAAIAYGPRVERLARLWQVIALKDALDTMEVGQDTVLFPTAVRQLVDALHGTGAGPLDASLLMREAPAPATWLSLSRATGGDDAATDWPTARNSLAAHVVQIVDQAVIAAPDGPETELLRRVRGRAAR